MADDGMQGLDGDSGSLGRLLLPLMGLLTLLAGLVTQHTAPLVSSRPDETAGGTSTGAAGGDRGRYAVPAPTWGPGVPGKMFEDPFEALDRIDSKNVPAINFASDFPRQFREILFGPATKDEGSASGATLISVLLLPGGPFDSSREERLRTQYAVLSGLLAEGFQMDFRERMTVFYVSVPVNVTSSTPGTITIGIPTKIFTRAPTGTPGKPAVERVLVLWLNESQLGKRPLCALAGILDQYLRGVPEEESKRRLRLAIVGPSSSDTFRAILLEDAGLGEKQDCAQQQAIDSRSLATASGNWTQVCPRDLLCLIWDSFVACSLPNPDASTFFTSHFHTADLVSPRATVPLEQLMLGGNYLKDLKKREGVLLSGLRLSLPIGTDEQLARALQWELELRGAWPEGSDLSKNSSKHVVLIYEQDTLYGRSFSQNLTPFLPPENIHLFGFRSGLDGKTPYHREGATRDDGAKGAAQPEPRQGEAQLDYLRNIADEIQARHDELRATGRGSIAAIGIIASDVFDKLLILRALRGKFPRARFFTTDLDARYWDRRDLDYARNLIVASHFGLSLRRDLGIDAVPFRDGYQTATLLSTLRLLENKSLLKAFKPEDISDPWGRLSEAGKGVLQPLIYEVGRTGPYRLPLREEETFTSRRLQPEAAQPLTGPAIGLLLLGVLLSGLLLSFYSLRVRRFLVHHVVILGKRHSQPRHPSESRWLTKIWRPFELKPISAIDGRQRWWLVGGILGGLILFIIMLYDSKRVAGEPLVILGGISVWPSIVLRAVGVIAGIACLGFVRSRFWPLRKCAKVKKRNDRFRNQVMPRIAVHVILYMALGLLLFYLTDTYPGIPSRGALSHWVCITVTMVEVVLFLAVSFLVIEAVGIQRRRINKEIRIWRSTGLDLSTTAAAASPKSDWPELAGRIDLHSQQLKKLRQIGRCTHYLGPLFYLPFVLVVFLVASRLRFFDGWDFEWSLLLTQSAILIATVLAVLQLRHRAAKARSTLLEIVGSTRSAMLTLAAAPPGSAAGTPRPGTSSHKGVKKAPAPSSIDPKNLLAAVEDQITRIRRERRGAFRPLLEDPILQAAIALPAGSTGLLYLIENLLGR